MTLQQLTVQALRQNATSMQLCHSRCDQHSVYYRLMRQSVQAIPVDLCWTLQDE